MEVSCISRELISARASAVFRPVGGYPGRRLDATKCRLIIPHQKFSCSILRQGKIGKGSGRVVRSDDKLLEQSPLSDLYLAQCPEMLGSGISRSVVGVLRSCLAPKAA